MCHLGRAVSGPTTSRFGLLSPVVSVTHAHLVLCAARELVRRPATGTARVLDVGCGNGNLLAAVTRFLPGLIGRPVDPRGFDVDDVAVQRRGFLAETEATLEAELPGYGWADRLDLVSSGDRWPADDGSADLVLTNQVLEHVRDLEDFMAQLSRVLAPRGVAVNLFPTRSSVVEGHVGVPWAHRIGSKDVRRRYLGAFARVGLARVGPLRMDGSLGWRAWADDRSDYLHASTWYRSWAEISAAAKRADLQPSYRWTPDFYHLKLGYLGGGERFVRYPVGGRSWIGDALLFRIFERIASVTVVFEKSHGYDPGDIGGRHR